MHRTGLFVLQSNPTEEKGRWTKCPPLNGTVLCFQIKKYLGEFKLLISIQMSSAHACFRRKQMRLTALAGSCPVFFPPQLLFLKLWLNTFIKPLPWDIFSPKECSKRAHFVCNPLADYVFHASQTRFTSLLFHCILHMYRYLKQKHMGSLWFIWIYCPWIETEKLALELYPQC